MLYMFSCTVVCMLCFQCFSPSPQLTSCSYTITLPLGNIVRGDVRCTMYYYKARVSHIHDIQYIVLVWYYIPTHRALSKASFIRMIHSAGPWYIRGLRDFYLHQPSIKKPRRNQVCTYIYILQFQYQPTLRRRLTD